MPSIPLEAGEEGGDARAHCGVPLGQTLTVSQSLVFSCATILPGSVEGLGTVCLSVRAGERSWPQASVLDG